MRLSEVSCAPVILHLCQAFVLAPRPHSLVTEVHLVPKRTRILLSCVVVALASGGLNPAFAVQRVVVAEDFTGTWCQFCPGAAMGLHNMATAVGDSVAIVEYHIGDVFQLPGCVTRKNFYGVSGYPTVWFDGVTSVVGGSSSTPINYMPKFRQRIVVPSPLELTLALQGYNARTGEGDIAVRATNVSDREAVGCVHLMLVADDTLYQWQNQTHLYFTAIQVDFGDATCVPLLPGETYEATMQMFTVPSGWRQCSISVVGFMQDPDTRVIHQGAVLHGVTSSLSQTVANGEMQLTWGPVFMATEYWVFGVANAPHFMPDVNPPYPDRVGVVQAPANTWSTAEGIGDPDANWTYLVIARNPQNQSMWQSNRVSEFEFGLEGGTP